MPGQIDALVLAQHAAVDDVADHVVADHFVDAQFDQAIGEQNARALFNVFSQRLESGAHQRGAARHFARRDGKAAARFQQHRLMILEFGGANLGSLEIAEDAERLALFAADFADHLDEGEFFLVRAMRKIQADDVDTRADQIAKNRYGIGRGAKRGNNLRASLGDRVVQDRFRKRHESAPGEVRLEKTAVFKGATGFILHGDGYSEFAIGPCVCYQGSGSA